MLAILPELNAFAACAFGHLLCRPDFVTLNGYALSAGAQACLGRTEPVAHLNFALMEKRISTSEHDHRKPYRNRFAPPFAALPR
jgi:hypothetical protein